MLKLVYVCSPRTYTLIKSKWPLKDKELLADYHCPNYIKLKGRGQKKLYAIVYNILSDRVDTIIIPNIYDWRKEK